MLPRKTEASSSDAQLCFASEQRNWHNFGVRSVVGLPAGGRAREHTLPSRSGPCSPLVRPTHPNMECSGLKTNWKLKMALTVKPISSPQNGYSQTGGWCHDDSVEEVLVPQCCTKQEVASNPSCCRAYAYHTLENFDRIRKRPVPDRLSHLKWVFSHRLKMWLNTWFAGARCGNRLPMRQSGSGFTAQTAEITGTRNNFIKTLMVWFWLCHFEVLRAVPGSIY